MATLVYSVDMTNTQTHMTITDRIHAEQDRRNAAIALETQLCKELFGHTDRLGLTTGEKQRLYAAMGV